MMGQAHRHFESIGSTNDAAREWARDGAPHGAIVTADAQTSGRGRRGREWSSPRGKGLYLSVIVRPEGGIEAVPRLTILAALAVRRAVQAIDQAHYPAGHFFTTAWIAEPLLCDFKWPNDVLMGGHKIAGVLCEAEWKGAVLDFAVVGVGINVNLELEDLPPRPIYPASSLLLETKQTWQRDDGTRHAWNIREVRDHWLREFEIALQMSETRRWPLLREEFWTCCAQRGQFVTIASEAATIRGIVTGLDGDGALLVQTGTEERRVLAGDILPPTES